MKSALGGHPWPASYFPFRVGRATSNADEGPHCDLNVPDVEPYQISRHHCSIVWAASVEGFVVQDADSKLGTIVNGVGIGGRSRIKSEPLRKGDNEVVLGGPNSPYRLSIRVP